VNRPIREAIGQKFGRLTVTHVEREGRLVYTSATCDCGKDWVGLLHNLRSGATKSCGCLHREIASAKMTERNKL